MPHNLELKIFKEISLTFEIITKQKNEGLYILDWVSWHIAIGIKKILIVSNDCTDGSIELINVLAEDNENIKHVDVTEINLEGKSVGARTISKINEILPNMRGSFVFSMDIDEFLCFREKTINHLSELNFDKEKIFSIRWLNCLPNDILSFSDEPTFSRNTRAVVKSNPKFPYSIGFNGKQMCYIKKGITLSNYHCFSIDGREIRQGEASGLFIKHCVTNSIDEFLLRTERGEASGFSDKVEKFNHLGQDILARETSNFKYAIDLFLMYASQQLSSDIELNQNIARNASEIKANFLSNSRIRAAQSKINNYYERKLQEIQKSYVSSIVKQLNLTHINSLNIEKLENFNESFFEKNQKKPHDYYVLMALAYLMENKHEQARKYCATGLEAFASVKLLAMMRSCILEAPFITYP